MGYATLDDFNVWGFPGRATIDVPSDVVERHIEAASKQADLWLSSIGGYIVPLSAWGEDLTRAVCEIAAYSLQKGNVGFAPEGPDAMIQERFTAARKEIVLMAALQSPYLVSGT